MKDRITRAFDDIRADADLLAKTAAHLQEERAKREKKQSGFRPLRLAGTWAAMLVLVVGILGYCAFYFDAAAYVGIDVNPSLELVLNRMDRVISATAYNEDGEALLQKVRVSGKAYDEAVGLLLAQMRSEGYLSGDAFITMTVQMEDGEKEQLLCDALMQTVGKQIDMEQSAAEVEVFPVTQQVRETAYECHMSAAKYLAIQALMEVDESATMEEYSAAPLEQIRQRTRECGEGHGNEHDSSGNKDQGNGQGQGSDQGKEDGHDRGNGQEQGGGHGHGSGQQSAGHRRRN